MPACGSSRSTTPTHRSGSDRLAEAGIDIPPSLVFAPVDFEHQGLDDGLMSAGFDRTLPAIFVWLGVVQYLTGEAVLATLQFIVSQNLAPQSYSTTVSRRRH